MQSLSRLAHVALAAEGANSAVCTSLENFRRQCR
jgi:hypothetical protein